MKNLSFISNIPKRTSPPAIVPNSTPFFKPTIQPKLTINQPNDIYEQEADAMAEKVMRMPGNVVTNNFIIKPATSSIQRKCAHCEEKEKKAQLKEKNNGVSEPSQETENYINALSGGRTLSEQERDFFEPRMGYDFSNVKIHSDTDAVRSAQSINALAYTTGNNIVFNAGQYNFSTESGKRLLGHELTHVVQQNNSVQPKFIQKLDCSLGHLDTECNNAASTCHRVDSYCASHYPDAASVNTLHSNAVAGARGRAATLPNASVNLLHFLDNSGTLLRMPVGIFQSDHATESALMEHRARFIAGAIARLNDGRLTPGGTADMVFTNTANAFSIFNQTDLGLAVGGYTLCSKVTVQATSLGGNSYEIRFIQWTVQAFDCYNWDPGKGIGLPGADDNDLCCLENNSRARHFRIETDVWNNINAASMANETVTASVGSSAPSTTTSSGSGSSSGGGIRGWLNSFFR